MINTDNPVLRFARDLIRRKSITPKDEGCQKLISDILEPLGFRIENLRYGEVDNLWAYHGHGSPVLCFAGHTDVVPAGSTKEWISDPFAADIHGDKLIARGAADMKSGLAAIVFACKRFIETYPNHNGSIALLITSDEEGEAQDGTYRVMETLSKRDEKIDWCVIGEPSCTQKLGDTVRIGRRGSLTGLMTLKGIQGHVAYPHDANNPAPVITKILNQIESIKLDNGTKNFQPSNLEIVNINTDNTADNVIPAEVRATFNIRFNNKHSSKSLKKKLNKIIKKICKKNKCSFKISYMVSGEAFITNPDKTTFMIQKIIKKITKIKTKLSTTGGISDARFIRKISPCVEFGLVGKTMHKIDEAVALNDLKKLTQIYNKILENYFK